MGAIKTFTGRFIYPLAPEPDVAAICFDDVAHALAQKPRFTGHLAVQYSVAEHSIRVAALLRASGRQPDVVLAGLLHDVGETYLPDVPSPIKNQVYLLLEPDADGAVELVPFRVQERRLRRAIFAALGLHDLIDPDDCLEIRCADSVFCTSEADDMLGGLGTTNPARHLGAIRPLTQDVAEVAFTLWYERARALADAAAGLGGGGS